jgi:hypothetical protein
MTEKQDRRNLEVSKETMAQLTRESIDKVTISDKVYAMPVVECDEDYEVYIRDNNEMVIRVAPPKDYHEMVDEMGSGVNPKYDDIE